MAEHLTCFKAYDIRGRIPDELNDEVAYRIAQAFAGYLEPARVVVGHDVRLSSPGLLEAIVTGLRNAGADVLNIGLCGTEEVYFATGHLEADGGIMITASHNPADYNGMKLVRSKARPISGDSGLEDIRRLAEEGKVIRRRSGRIVNAETRRDYVDHLLSYVDSANLKPLKLAVNAGNGGAGIVIDALEKRLPFEFVKLNHAPDGHFPNGIPNPLLPENRQETGDAVCQSGADLGIAWDGDFDRCFLFDETGSFVEGYYVVGLLARVVLANHPGARIIHDPRLVWNTREIVANCGGVPVQTKTGHAFIKERMRQEDAAYGGEMSAHHYFRDFAYCDSGMIPWLLVTQLLSNGDAALSELLSESCRAYPVSGEINRRVADPQALLARIRKTFEHQAIGCDETDGISFEFPEWRFNLRMSNTEPVVRLNVESRGDLALLETSTAELLELIDAPPG